MKNIFSILIILLFISFSSSAQKIIGVQRLPFNQDDLDEISPVIYQNGLIFSANRKSSLVGTTDMNNNFPFKLYFVEKKERRRWGAPRLFAPEVSGNLHETSAVFSEDLKVMYFTRTLGADEKLSKLQQTDEKLKLGIFQATNTGKKWILSKEFPFNDPAYNVAYPCLSPDGTLLAFSMADENGRYDIYISEQMNGRWSNPEKLGPEINTDQDEVTPFFHLNGRLYFSSQGHNSTGGLDIFYTEKINDKWITPVNLPRQINSRRNDFGYVLSADMDTGYFASDRRNNRYDIYMFASEFPAFEKCPDQIEEIFCYDFNETGSIDLDTTSLKYEWDFGDGQKERSTTASHCFSQPGLYLVSLNVIDTLTGEVYFSEASYDLNVKRVEQPYITIADTVEVNEQVKMDADSSVVRSFTPEEYYWDFGDGNIETGKETEHIYNKTGSYFIRLGIISNEDTGDNEEIDYSKRACARKQIIVIKK